MDTRIITESTYTVFAVAVTTIPDRCLSFQIVFTGCEADDGSQENVHGGAMWARMPITALVGDIPLEQWPERMQTHLAQPWDCSSYNHAVVKFNRTHAITVAVQNRRRVLHRAVFIHR
jgi:hypothetical protein